MIKIRNVGVGDGEVKKINFQQHPQGLPESQKTPPHRHPFSLLVLQGSDAFCFLMYRRLCLILICCSSEKLAQILHGD